ncbi:LuxR C-terminal-related transcriptional regulator [Amycolatopsis sp. cg5]|uniref:LuxR C-terminal-related transcriptional regulator n=1 Tax=Amycolatopsis sp. cg5 TaxID=3238802 RepID=UPI003524D205
MRCGLIVKTLTSARIRVSEGDSMDSTSVFAERHGVLAELAGLARGTTAARLAVVTGAAGSGKSTLLRAFRSKAADHAEVWHGLCRGAGASVRPLFDGFLRGGAKPKVLVLEDVQWADDSTLDLLSAVTRGLRDAKASVVLAYRDDEIGATHGLRAVLAGVPACRLPLPALSEPTLAALAAELDLTTAELIRETGGNPSLISEIALRRVLERSLPERRRAAADAVRVLIQRASEEAGVRARDLCEHDLERALALATEHRLATREVLSIRAWSRFLSGDWASAERDALAAGPESLPGRCVLARVSARRGVPMSLTADRDLDTLRDRVLLAVARAESGWLSGERMPDADELRPVFHAASEAGHPWYAGELALWLRRAGEVTPGADWFAEPYRLLAAGQWRRAADAWRDLGCAYEQADSLAMTGEAGALRALVMFDELGATGAARRLRRRLRHHGVRRVPRGPRPETVANPAGLTSRQAQVLAGIASGLSNAGIAERMNLSVRTVDHHVAAILTKLAVGSRRAAVAAAIELGILPEPALGI